jgi:hypothetical protein
MSPQKGAREAATIAASLHAESTALHNRARLYTEIAWLLEGKRRGRKPQLRFVPVAEAQRQLGKRRPPKRRPPRPSRKATTSP